MNDRPVVVTGAGGFIGGHLIARLRQQGYRRIRGVDVKPFDEWYQIFGDVENLALDLNLMENCERAARGAVDVYNLAANMGGMGFIEKNKALYEDRSPINFIDRIKSPLYLLAGGNDPRCPKEEAQQVVDAVKKRGGIVEYKVYENEGHGFAKVENQIDAYKRVVDFIKAHVPPADCVCSLNE